MSLTARIGLALVVALALGILVSATDVPGLRALPALLEPVGTLWVNAIRMTVVPLVVALVITGILSARDARTVGRVGGGAVLLFASFVAVSTLYALLLAPPLLGLLPIDPGAADALRARAAGGPMPELPPFRNWLVELVPVNPVRAAADGAMLPLLVFTVLFALAAARTATESRQSLLLFFRAVADAVFVLIRWILALAPIGVLGLVLPLAASMGVAAAGAFGYFVGVASLLVTGALLALYPVTAWLTGIPVRDFARGCAPAQAVGFSTRSSLAALPAMIEGAETRLGVPTHVTSLALPAAVSIFKFASPIVRFAGTLFVARLYGVELAGPQLVAIAAAVGLLSFYSPGIPSGGLFVMTPLYLEFGLPVEGIGLLIALDLVPDMFITTANVTANLSVAAVLARRTAHDPAPAAAEPGAAPPTREASPGTGDPVRG
jgi:proton glutamate symport protein